MTMTNSIKNLKYVLCIKMMAWAYFNYIKNCFWIRYIFLHKVWQSSWLKFLKTILSNAQNVLQTVQY